MYMVPLAAVGRSEIPLLLDAFKSMGMQFFRKITQEMHWIQNDPRIEACFDILRGKDPVFKYRIINATKTPWRARVTGTPYCLVDIGSLSPSLPKYGWVNSAILCLHDIYHAQNTSVLQRAETVSDDTHDGKRLTDVTPSPPHTTINIDFTFHPSTNNSIARESLNKIMHSVWAQLLGYGGLCSFDNRKGHNSCGMNQQWTLYDLNRLDVNQVPMLICNKWACIRSSGPHSSMESELPGEVFNFNNFLISSGWTYNKDRGTHRRAFDWYKFLYEHFHLRWLTFEYKRGYAQRVALFSTQNRLNGLSTINRANISLIVLASAFNVFFCAFALYGTKPSQLHGNVEYLNSIDDFLCIATLVIFFPTFDDSYSKAAFFVILSVQIIIAYAMSSEFISQWQKGREFWVTKSDACHLNSLLLKHGMARCKCRFGLLAMALLAYIHFGNVECTGYTPSPGCKVEQRGNCTGLLYCTCACFYYTVAASQLMYSTKHTYTNQFSMVLFRCTTVALLSAALLYSIFTVVHD